MACSRLCSQALLCSRRSCASLLLLAVPDSLGTNTCSGHRLQSIFSAQNTGWGASSYWLLWVPALVGTLSAADIG